VKVLKKATMQTEDPDPSPILKLGSAFLSSKIFLTAAKLELFTLLSHVPLSGEKNWLRIKH